MRRQAFLFASLTLVAMITAAPGFAQEAKAEKPWRLGDAIDAPDWLDVSGSVRPRYETLTNTFTAGRTGGDEFLSVQSLLKAEIKAGLIIVGGELEDTRLLSANAAAGLLVKSIRLNPPNSISPGAPKTS